MVVVSDEVVGKVRRFIDMVSASGLHLERVILFGSHAKGNCEHMEKRLNPFIIKTMILPQRSQRINYGFFNGTDYSGGNRCSSYPVTRLIGIHLQRSPMP